MKRIVLVFGLIAGAILSAMMLATIPFMDRIGFEYGAMIGYTTMVVAYLMVFFGIRSYRDNVAGGELTFGRGFKIGALITAIASICYVLTWQVVNHQFVPDFTEKYAAYAIDKERQAGADAAALAEKQAELDRFQEMYRNPLFNVGITLLEVLPVGLVMTALSAALLRRRSPAPQPA